MVRRRAEVPPQPEAWEGPVVGERRVLRTDGDQAECHICSGWYKLLGSHVFKAHGRYAQTYRRLFGLRQRTGLAGEARRARRRSGAAHRDASRQFLLALTPEERSANARGRVVALESRRDPANRRVWRPGPGTLHKNSPEDNPCYGLPLRATTLPSQRSPRISGVDPSGRLRPGPSRS
jgi:hypothetical protein